MLSNPEFMAEGTAVNDVLNPDRVIIGGRENEKKEIEKIRELYYWISDDKIITPSTISSELSKIVANSFLA